MEELQGFPVNAQPVKARKKYGFSQMSVGQRMIGDHLMVRAAKAWASKHGVPLIYAYIGDSWSIWRPNPDGHWGKGITKLVSDPAGFV